MNGPLFVPRTVTRTDTRSPSETRSSTVTAELMNLVRHAMTEPPHDLRSDLALATMWMTLLERLEQLTNLPQ